MCLCWVYNFMILLYRNSTTKNISQNHKIVHFENYSFSLDYYNQQPIRNVDYMKYCLYGCSCLVVWYYIFIWLLVLFGRCCTFFHLQGAFLTHGNYFRKIGAREK